MDRKQNLDAQAVLTHLERLCSAGESGTIMLTPENSGPGQLTISNGKLIAARHLRKKGIDAIHCLFEGNSFSSYMFKPRKAIVNTLTPTEVHDTHVMLLANIQRLANPDRRNFVKRIHTEEPPAKQSGQLSDEIKSLVIDEMTVQIGPAAPILCKRHFRTVQSDSDLIGSIDKLAALITNSTKRDAFVTTVRRKASVVKA